MTPDLARLTEEWRNVDQVHELVKQEGDAACERALDFLLRQANLGRAVVEAARMMVSGVDLRLLGEPSADGDAARAAVASLADALAAHDARR